MKNLDLNKNEVEVTDGGRVLISSEELANAIQSCDVDLTSEEEAEGNICITITIS